MSEAGPQQRLGVHRPRPHRFLARTAGSPSMLRAAPAPRPPDSTARIFRAALGAELSASLDTPSAGCGVRTVAGFLPSVSCCFLQKELSRNPPLVKADSARYARLLFALAIIKALNVLCEAVCRKPSPTSRNPALGAIYRMKSRSKPKKMQNTVKERG